MIKGFDGINPTIDNSAFVAESADIIGDVVIEKDANIWYNTVLRGDANKIIVGENSNVQDGSIVHCGEESPTIIGKNVTIGHGAIIHGCNIGDYSLIGMGSIILNDAEIGEFTMVGAGSLVTSKKFPPGVLLLGSPAKVVRELTDKEKESLRISEFLLQFYIEKMLNLKNGKENVQFCKEIIKQGDIFSEILEDLNINKKEKHEIFIKCVKENINDYYMSSDMEDMKKSNKIIIATPYTYINANINRKIQLWLDIGSNVWNMKIEKDISNPLVLRKSFKEKIYSDEMEENYKKYYLYNLIYNLLINSEEVYAFKSDYSVNGFMQESMMYTLLLRLLDKGEKVDE